MPTTVDRCEKCGQFVYHLELWISGETIQIDAGTKKAFVVDDIVHDNLYGMPTFRLTEAVPAEVFVTHQCTGVPQ